MKEKPFVIKSPVFYDERGTFTPTPIRFTHKDDLCLRKDWLQTNLSINPKAHTFRGMHYQNPHPQTKLVKVIQGSITDFAVDLHPTTFGEFHIFVLNAGDAVYIPKGFAHGFLTREPDTIVQYMVDEDYRPEYEGSIAWNSIKEINNIMCLMDDIVISEKDSRAKSLTHYRETTKPSLDEVMRMAYSDLKKWEIEVIDDRGNDLIVMAPNGDTQYMSKDEYVKLLDSYKNKTNTK